MKSIKILLALFVILMMTLSTNAQDYLLSTSGTGDGTTTDNSKAWTDIASVTIDVTDMSNLLISVGINMRPDGVEITGREANYRIYRSDDITDNSGIIKRQMVRNGETGDESWGVGTLVHIFDVSLLSGNKTFVLEHSNQGNSETGRNVYSNTKMTAVALTTKTNNYELSNDLKRLDADVTTTSATFVPVTGLTTSSISLPIDGDIFVSVSINGRSNGSSVAEYILQYSTDDGANWADLGKPVKRSMINTWDDGIVSLVAMLQDQTAGSGFQFRVQHRRVSGTSTITTHYCNLIAVALAHSGDDYFPSFYSELGTTGVNITGVSTSPSTVLSASLLTNFDINSSGPNLFIGAQYLVSASNLDESTPQRMRAGNNLFVDDGTDVKLEEYYRYIPDNSNYGSGGFFGLVTNLNENTEYIVGMKHQVAYVSNPNDPVNEDEVLNSSQVILTGFQTYDVTGGTTLPIELTFFSAKQDDDVVRLDWQTASEKNNDYFTVERSSDTKKWEEIEFVAGAGNSSLVLDYTTIDKHPLKYQSYYRLKQTDFDYRFFYSKIIVLNNISNESSIIINYNSQVKQLTVQSLTEELPEVYIYSSTGLFVNSNVDNISKESHKNVFDFSKLSAGVYIIKAGSFAKQFTVL